MNAHCRITSLQANQDKSSIKMPSGGAQIVGNIPPNIPYGEDKFSSSVWSRSSHLFSQRPIWSSILFLQRPSRCLCKAGTELHSTLLLLPPTGEVAAVLAAWNIQTSSCYETLCGGDSNHQKSVGQTTFCEIAPFPWGWKRRIYG